MPSRLAREPHAPDWYFEQSARAIQLFPLDHNLWRVPMDLLKAIPPDQLPGDLADRTLSDARQRDPHYFLYQDLHSG